MTKLQKQSELSVTPESLSSHVSRGKLRMSAKTRSSGPEQSINRILDATMDATSRQGLRGLSMSNICREAGVARGTLYRYFPTKEVLLESLGQRTRDRMEHGLKSAVASAKTGTECLAKVVEFMADFSVEAKTDNILAVEPQFFVDFLRRNNKHYTAVLTQVLSPFFDEIEESVGGPIDRQMIADLILRLNTSFAFVPSEKPRDQLMAEIAAMIKILVGNGQD